MPLTDLAIRNTKPADKTQKLFGGGGLFLPLAPAGQRYWRLKYRVAGKEKLLALGAYLDVSLQSARKRRDEAKEKLADGIDLGLRRFWAPCTGAQAPEARANN
jgi:hypothetical protein